MGGVDRKTMLHTGLVTSAARGSAVPRSWVGRLTMADGRMSQFAIGARPVILGADGSCDLVLDDPEVSRRHAEVVGTIEGVRVRDLGSTNGTFWQSSRVTDVVVPGGASVRFGQSVVRFASGDIPSVPPSERRRFAGLVGESVAMRELFAVLELSAPTNVTVLIQGESGTGKEVAARAIHDHSPRARVPLVIVDCGAVSEQLIDSQLFGHVRGAFTGAERDRKGAFVEASGGTLLLDEIGELPMALQSKLLRVLEARTVQPLGSDRPVEVDTRVIAASHRDLRRMVEDKKFRFDLFYRLSVVHAAIPPLRERVEDIAELVRHFYEGRGVDPGPVDGPNLDRLRQYGWPGNVRELRNVLERGWALGSAAGDRFRDLRLWVGTDGRAPPSEVIDTTLPFKDAKERWVDEFERRYLSALYARYEHNITHAADHAGINRRHLRTLLKKHGIIEGEE